MPSAEATPPSKKPMLTSCSICLSSPSPSATRKALSEWSIAVEFSLKGMPRPSVKSRMFFSFTDASSAVARPIITKSLWTGSSVTLTTYISTSDFSSSS